MTTAVSVETVSVIVVSLVAAVAVGALLVVPVPVVPVGCGVATIDCAGAATGSSGGSDCGGGESGSTFAAARRVVERPDLRFGVVLPLRAALF